MDISKFLDPKLINSVADLELIAKMISNAMSLGINRSKQVGFGQEFSQYRSYEPGDDLRYLDWKLFARNDRYYIRQSDIESHITVRFVIDCSASMNHEYNGLKKLDFVKLLVATFAYIIQNQHDYLALHSLSDQTIVSYDIHHNASSFHKFLYHLVQLNAESGMAISDERFVKEITSNRKELIIFISDMYEEENELSSLIELTAKSKEEFVLFHILAENELNPRKEKHQVLKDLESNEIIQTSDLSSYQENIDHFLSKTEETITKLGGSYQPFHSYTNIDAVIRQFIQLRGRL